MNIHQALELLTISPQRMTNNQVDQLEILDSIIDEYPVTPVTKALKARTGMVLERVKTTIPKVSKYRPRSYY